MATDDTKAKGAPRLALDSPKNARKTISRLCRMRFRGEIDSERFRDLVYALSTMRAYDALLADLRIDERLDLIEAQIKEGKK
jgi:hypothetical protein